MSSGRPATSDYTGLWIARLRYVPCHVLPERPAHVEEVITLDVIQGWTLFQELFRGYSWFLPGMDLPYVHLSAKS